MADTLKELVELWRRQAKERSAEASMVQAGDALQLENRIIAFDREIETLISKGTSVRKIVLLRWFQIRVLGTVAEKLARERGEHGG